MAPDIATANLVYEFARNAAIETEAQSPGSESSSQRNAQLQETFRDLTQQAQNEKRELQRVGGLPIPRSPCKLI